MSRAVPLARITLGVAALALVPVVNSCSDPAANATVLDLTVSFDEGVAINQVRVSLSVEGGDAFQPFLVPEAPRALSAAGESAEIILPDEVGGQRLLVVVDGMDGADARCQGDGEVDVVRGQRVSLALYLALPEEGECGNGVLEGSEGCDDADTDAGDGCDDACATEPGWVCVVEDVEAGGPSVCNETCGDGAIEGAEQCDDENVDDGDGCDANCAIEEGFVCNGEPSQCSANCGNGAVDDGEQCDDADRDAGDGCDASCAVEAGYACTAEPGAPSVCAETCDNGQLDAGEQCDDGGRVDGDGCSAACAIEQGFTCDTPGAACAPICGDGLLRGGEPCDDQNTADGDGCSATCAREPGFICAAGKPTTCQRGCTIGGVDFIDGALDPSNPCRACRSTFDPAAFSNVDDGTPCDDGQFCNGFETCTTGTCTSGAAPCSSVTQPLCIEAADLCSCAGSSCDNGQFCDGVEACAPDGSCQSGTAPSCAPPTGLCSENLDRCVECDDDGDCAAPNGFCFAATNQCTECPTCPCRFGDHDGGDGACVPAGTCSPGFARGFLDADLDGVGSGPLLNDCEVDPFVPGSGVSATNTDCDDGNGTIFQQLTVFPDNDLDGFTAAAVSECLGASLPANRKASARPPPLVSFQAASSVEFEPPGGDPLNGSVDWSDEGDVFFRDENDANANSISGNSFTDPLRITNFDLRVPAGAVITGIAVHINRDMTDRNVGAVVDRTITLLGGSGTSANRALPDPWPLSPTRNPAVTVEVTYGGSDDLWGLTWTPAQVNSAAFGVQIALGASAGASGCDAEIEHVWIEVFTDGGVDCDDGNSASWATLPSFTDVDDDKFGAGAESGRCVGVAVPANVVQRSAGADCFDANPNAHPGQTSFFGVNRGDGSFDYDCDGNNGTGTDKSPNATSNTEDRTCSCDTVNGVCNATTGTVSVGGCGSSFSDDFCTNDGTCVVGGAGGGCALTQSSTQVRCR